MVTGRKELDMTEQLLLTHTLMDGYRNKGCKISCPYSIELNAVQI